MFPRPGSGNCASIASSSSTEGVRARGRLLIGLGGRLLRLRGGKLLGPRAGGRVLGCGGRLSGGKVECCARVAAGGALERRAGATLMRTGGMVAPSGGIVLGMGKGGSLNIAASSQATSVA